MPDSFADLWSSSVPSKSTSSQTLGTAKPQPSTSNNIPQRSQNDPFFFLSASQPTSRTHSPKFTNSTSTTSTQSRNTISAGTSRNGDAFSGLLSGSLTDGRNHTTANMTMAERAVAAQKAKLQQATAPHTTNTPLPSAWDGLDTLAQSSTTLRHSPSLSPQEVFPVFASSSSTTSKSPVPDDDWGLSDFAAPHPLPTSRKQPAKELWDIDDFHSPSPSDPPISGDFHFGDREDGLLESYSDDGNDDILGDLGRPVDVVKTSSNDQSPRVPQSQRPALRSVSPPPHIVGKIVEMGFSPQQARVALAATDTGLDLQAALETLLANGAGDTSTPPPSQARDHEARPPPRRPSNQRGGSNRHRDREPPRDTERDAQHSPDLNAQAERILAQASGIGISVLNRANALWKESKEKAQRIYEERANAALAATQRDGRPRWKTEEGSDRGGTEQVDMGLTSGFKDDDENPPPTVRPTRRKEGQQKQTSSQLVESPSQFQPTEVDLFSSEAPEAPIYQSRFRRGRLTPQPQPPTVPSRHAAIPLPSRPRRIPVPASPLALSRSASYKATGTSAYKLGQYANAESAYSLAIAALPSSHILLIPLHNNRALTRLKTGDIHGAIEDCTSVIEIIGDDRGVFEEVDLADALVKAWRRRAEAAEGRERWEEARKDWELVAGAEWAPPSVRAEGVRGVGRCRRMVNSNTDEAISVPKSKPKPKAPWIKHTPTPTSSEALKALRAVTSAAEAEENQRHELKDSVDARITAWKGSKETNVRALIASLDSVLWPELGWQKVGMHELVSNAQVKSRYMRAISRVHPDKLSAQNTTVEQRMIASGVFGILNEAWCAFQQ